MLIAVNLLIVLPAGLVLPVNVAMLLVLLKPIAPVRWLLQLLEVVVLTAGIAERNVRPVAVMPVLGVCGQRTTK
jgi:hypothetical protein